MLSYNLVDFSFRSADKDLDFATQFDEPLYDLFDQYVSQDSSSSSDNVTGPPEYGLFDLTGGADTTSGSYIADQPASNFSHPQSGRLHRSTRIAFPLTRSSEPVLQKRHHRSACFERPTAAISGAELLSLEGKLPHQTPSTQRPSYLGTPSLPLRRKPKFTLESLRLSNHRVSKSGASNGNDLSSMIRQPQQYRQETPEWTNRFERISLQTPSTSHQPPSQSSSSIAEDQVSRQSSSQAQTHNAQQVSLNNTITVGQNHCSTEDPKHDPLTSTLDFLTASDFTDHSIISGQTNPSLNQGLPSTWSQLSQEQEFDFAISPKDMHQDWSQTSGPYYENSGAVQSAPALSQPDSVFSNESHLLQCNSFGQFISEDPSDNYIVGSMDPFHMSPNNTYPPSLISINNALKTSSPSSRSSSVCPSPPPSAKPHSKTRKRSKSSRRKSSAGTLKSPKSAGALGFVNFTPSDSQKILTGVAPSGSSKTKARRELEAIERKRKLSVAAERVIREAGGDPEKLRAAGLI